MLTNERHFRILQLCCIVTVLVFFRFGRAVADTATEPTLMRWVVIGMGVWASTAGFILERKIVRSGARSSNRSTPLSRWRAGNLLRVASASSVAAWGLILRVIGGPALIANIFFAVAGILLVIWRPSARPT